MLISLLGLIHSNSAMDQGESSEIQSGDAENEVHDDVVDQINNAGDQSEQQQSDIVAVVSSSSSNYNPYLTFDIEKCDTYSHLWEFDLLIQCNEDATNCQCVYAEQLMARGLLSCSDAPRCPDSCDVCLHCLSHVCGLNTMSASIIQSGSRVLPAASLVAIILAVCFVFARKKDGVEVLKESLIVTETESGNWMVPVSTKTGLPDQEGDAYKPVWIAPANTSEPTMTVESNRTETTTVRKRVETAMLVVVPGKSLPATKQGRHSQSNNLLKKEEALDFHNEKQDFPDLLKDHDESHEFENIDSGRRITPNDSLSAGDLTPTCEENGEEFTPGLWLVPLSNESVASSMSESTDDEGTLDSEDLETCQSSDEPSTDEDHGEVDYWSEESGDNDDEYHDVDSEAILHGPSGDFMGSFVVDNEETDGLDEVVISADNSTISSRIDGDLSIGSMMGEI